MLTLVNSTVADNIASSAANIGVGERLEAFGSVIGPAKLDGNGGRATADKNCDAPIGTSLGFNVVTDTSCRIAGPGDSSVVASSLEPLRENGGSHETRMPQAPSPALDRVPDRRLPQPSAARAT